MGRPESGPTVLAGLRLRRAWDSGPAGTRPWRAARRPQPHPDPRARTDARVHTGPGLAPLSRQDLTAHTSTPGTCMHVRAQTYAPPPDTQSDDLRARRAAAALPEPLWAFGRSSPRRRRRFALADTRDPWAQYKSRPSPFPYLWLGQAKGEVTSETRRGPTQHRRPLGSRSPSLPPSTLL